MLVLEANGVDVVVGVAFHDGFLFRFDVLL